MKKILSLLLAAVMALLLCACEGTSLDLPPLPEVSITPTPTLNPTPTEAPEATPELPEEPEEEPVVEVLANRVLVSFQNSTIEDYDPAEGTQLILTFSYVTPRVYIEGREEAAAAINEYIALLDETYYTGNDYGAGSAPGYYYMLELAQDNYAYVVDTDAEGMPLEFSSTRSARIARADDRMLNVVFGFYEFTGGVHGNYGERAYVFDTETGERLRLDQLTTDFDAFAAFLVESMEAQAESDPDIAQAIDPATVPREEYGAAFEALLREGSWYFDNEGLMIFSDLYELGPYAAGTVSFRIPYAALSGKIEERWLPAARGGQGEFHILPLGEVEDGTVEIVDRVVAQEDGEELCLIASGTVYDVTLSTVYYVDKFYEHDQLWHGSYLQDGAVQLVTVIPEGLPELMVSYTTADGQRHMKLLSESGQDGTLLLVDDNIEAVG